MLRIRITAVEDPLADGRKVTRRTVKFINEDGEVAFKTDVPTAERIARAMSNDESSLGDQAEAINRALGKLAPTERKRKAASEETILVDVE